MKTVLRKLEWVLRHAIVYPFLKSVLKNNPVEGHLDLSSVRSILLLRYDKLGDMIVTKPIFRILKSRNPGLKLGVVTSRANAEIIADDPHVDQKHVLDSHPLRLASMLRDARGEHYEIVVNLIFNRTTTGALLANIISPDGVKIGQGEEKYRFYFNKLITLPRSQLHMVEVLANYVSQVFGLSIKPEELDLFYEIDSHARSAVDQFLASHALVRRQESRDLMKYVIVNLSAGEQVNKLSLIQVSDVVRHLSQSKEIVTVLIFDPTDETKARAVETALSPARCIRFSANGKAPLSQIASLIEGALFVITPDTSIVHFASAVHTPTFAIFSPLRKSKEWFPFNVPFSTVTAEENMPVSSLPSSKVIDAIETFRAELANSHQRKEHA